MIAVYTVKIICKYKNIYTVYWLVIQICGLCNDAIECTCKNHVNHLQSDLNKSKVRHFTPPQYSSF